MRAIKITNMETTLFGGVHGDGRFGPLSFRWRLVTRLDITHLKIKMINDLYHFLVSTIVTTFKPLLYLLC